MVAALSPNETPNAANTPFLTDAQVEAMSQEEILAYFNRLRQVAVARGVTLPGASPKSHSAGTSIESVLSRAGILARAQHAMDKAEERRDRTKGEYETVLASYIKANNLTELPAATQEQIDTHVATARQNAQSGYEKVAATNKGRQKRKGSVEAHLETVESAAGDILAEGDTPTEE